MLSQTLGALLLAASPAMSFEQPPASTVLALVDARGVSQLVRLNLPAVIETVRLESEQRLSIAARMEIPASLELGGERLSATISLGAAQGVRGEQHRVRLSRTLSVRARDLELALLTDVVLAPEPGSLGAGELSVERFAVVAVTSAEGRLKGLELTRHAFFAHPKVPMRWVQPGSVAKWKAESREGWLVLGQGLYPEVFLDGQEVTVLMDVGSEAKRWRLRVEDGIWTDGERFIEWSEEPGRWIGRVRGFDSVDVSSVRLGDAESPLSIDLLSSEVPAGERAGL